MSKMREQDKDKPLVVSPALRAHLTRIIEGKLIDDPRIVINGKLEKDEKYRIGFSDLKERSYRKVVFKYSDADLELQREGQTNNDFWWARFKKKSETDMRKAIDDIEAELNRRGVAFVSGNGDDNNGAAGGANANANALALVNPMADVHLGGGGGGVSGPDNLALIPVQPGGGGTAVGAGGQLVAAAPGQQVGPPNHGGTMNTFAPQQAIHHVHYHGNVYQNHYQNGGDVAITTNAINGGGGPPNGPFAAGGAAGPGAAAGTGAGADPLLLGGGEAGVSTPTNATRAPEEAAAFESRMQATVTRALQAGLRQWDEGTSNKLDKILNEIMSGLNNGDSAKRELFPRDERNGSKEALKKLLEENEDNDDVAGFLDEWSERLDDVGSFLLTVPSIMNDEAVRLIVDLVSGNDDALARNCIIAFKLLGRTGIDGFLASEVVEDGRDEDPERLFHDECMAAISGIVDGYNSPDGRSYYIDVKTVAPSSGKERTTRFAIFTTAGASATLILQPLIYLIGHIAQRERVTALAFPGGKEDIISNGPDFLNVDFSGMLQSMGGLLPCIEFQKLTLTEEQVACIAASASASSIKFTTCTIPCNEFGENALLEALAAIEPGGNPASIVLHETVLEAGHVDDEINGRVVTVKAKEIAKRTQALQILADLVREKKLTRVKLDYTLISRKELVALEGLHKALMDTDGCDATFLLGKYSEATGIGSSPSNWQSDWKRGNIKKFLDPDNAVKLLPWEAPLTMSKKPKPCKMCQEGNLCRLHQHCVDY